MLRPCDFVGRCQHMRDVAFALSEHIIGPVMLYYHHIFCPRPVKDWTVAVPCPYNPIGTCCITERHLRSPGRIIPGIPKMIAILFAQDVSSFPDLMIPGVLPGACEKRVAFISRKGCQFRRKAEIAGSAGRSFGTSAHKA